MHSGTDWQFYESRQDWKAVQRGECRRIRDRSVFDSAVEMRAAESRHRLMIDRTVRRIRLIEGHDDTQVLEGGER